MIDVHREIARVKYPLLAISASAWVLLIALPRAAGLPLHCMTVDSGSAPPGESLRMMLAMNPPVYLLAGWALMLAAMMLPVTVAAVHHIRFSSFSRRRARSIALFLAGYGGLWMVFGIPMTAIEIGVSAFAPKSLLPEAIAVLAAVVWQASPIKQYCLNRCHDLRPIAVFGFEADVDAFRFGLAHGAWCVTSCWLLMLCPMLLPAQPDWIHLAAMAAAAILVFCERTESPEPPRWKLRGLGRAIRIAAAQLRICSQEFFDGKNRIKAG